MTTPLQAKKNYVQAVMDLPTKHQKEEITHATQDLQRLGIEPNYSLIVTELKGL